LIEHGLTSAQTQYRLYSRRFLQVKRPNQQYQSTEGDYTYKTMETQTKKDNNRQEGFWVSENGSSSYITRVHSILKGQNSRTFQGLSST